MRSWLWGPCGGSPAERSLVAGKNRPGTVPAALDAVATFPYYATCLREEGRLAALAGDPEGAIRAYRHYLALRSEAEPSLQPEVRRVREELDALSRESTDR